MYAPLGRGNFIPSAGAMLVSSSDLEVNISLNGTTINKTP